MVAMASLHSLTMTSSQAVEMVGTEPPSMAVMYLSTTVSIFRSLLVTPVRFKYISDSDSRSFPTRLATVYVGSPETLSIVPSPRDPSRDHTETPTRILNTDAVHLLLHEAHEGRAVERAPANLLGLEVRLVQIPADSIKVLDSGKGGSV